MHATEERILAQVLRRAAAMGESGARVTWTEEDVVVGSKSVHAGESALGQLHMDLNQKVLRSPNETRRPSAEATTPS